jgi:CheY-like chemotaxis protein
LVPWEIELVMEHADNGAGPAVLVVDDEPWLRMTLSDAFTDEGYSVAEAGNAAEALAILQAQRDIGVVITDIQMPGSMDGLRLARYIRDAYPPIALVVASGAVRPHLNELPADAIFLSKPIDIPQLLARIAELVAARSRG